MDFLLTLFHSRFLYVVDRILRSYHECQVSWLVRLWRLFSNYSSLFSFLTSEFDASKCKESILPSLIEKLKNCQIPSPSPIAVQAVIGGIISQTLVSVVTGEGELKDGIEFDALSLNVTEFSY